MITETDPVSATYAGLEESLDKLRAVALEYELRLQQEIERIPSGERDSARNLLHYLGVRSVDIRDLQFQLHTHGLSSLGRMEAYVLASIDAVKYAILALQHKESGAPDSTPPVDFTTGRTLLDQRADVLFGAAHDGSPVRVMVTMPDEAAESSEPIRELIEAGMNLARVNCAKQSPDDWRRMIQNIRRASKESGRLCRVLIDLPGPNPRIGAIHSTAGEVRLQQGDRVWLSTADAMEKGLDGVAVAVVECTLPEAIAAGKVGDRVYYDDGAFEGRVIEAHVDRMLFEIVHLSGNSAKLKTAKGLNFPDTQMQLPTPTPGDYEVIKSVASLADLVGLSFLRTPNDVVDYAEALQPHLTEGTGIILKVETRDAFENLPKLLLAAIRTPPVGVMLARGDLGVEVGFERMAEVQEEVLWVCEAAHIPVIWATQVLENLTRKGLPSRSEVTDAAMSGRAECVMLNKGKNIVNTVRFLRDVLDRMAAHQQKRMATLRKLHVSALTE